MDNELEKQIRLPSTPPEEMSLDELAEILSLTIKYDRDNKLITFLCMLSAYTDGSQLNVSFNAPSSSGKTYMTTEIAKLFPKEDKIERSGASPTSFFYSEGKFDKERNAKIVSFERKIMIFYEQPNPELQKRLRPVLSHDEWELTFSNTNKIKGTNKAEQTIIQGWPATIFCSAGLQLDEQEATRAILLSPEVTENKLKQGVKLQFRRGANEVEYDRWLESQTERTALMQRIIAIREEKVGDIIIADPDKIEEMFYQNVSKIQPRHMRDSGHLLKLIKAVALLNVWHRRQPDGAIVANQSDIDEAFALWNTVIESQDLNVPPAVLNFYKEFVLPAYLDKMKDNDYRENMEAGYIGLSNSELGAYYLRCEQKTLNHDLLRRQILPQLEASGMISIEKPTWDDGRSKHIFPKIGLPDNLLNTDVNNIGQGGGGNTDLPEEVLRQFFGR